MRIGFIDSGVGGLSILQAVRQLVVADYIYVMDNRYLPYGEKSETFIQQRLSQLSALLISLRVDLIVIACNTATTQAVASLRQQFSIPFVGTVPAIKPAATLCMGLGFSVLATPATSTGSYLQGLINDFAPRLPIKKYGSSELVKLAEAKVWYQQDVSNAVEQEVKRLGMLETSEHLVVLGCTHFPFLTPELKNALPHAEFLDTAHAIANRVWTLTKEKHSEVASGCNLYIATAALDSTQQRRVTELGFQNYQCWATELQTEEKEPE